MKLESLLKRPRLMFSSTLALITYIFLIFSNILSNLSLLEKTLISYNVFQWGYFIGLLYLIHTSQTARIKKRALIEDESANFVLGFSSIASVVAIVAIAFELGSARGSHGVLMGLHLGLPALTLFGVWCLIPSLFAIHYAHLYYLNEHHRPFDFPEESENPDYFDFLYFSITIALTSQTSDVTIMTKRARRLVLVQSVLAFIFNTSVLALGINVAAGLLNN
jgi:uncharacterized membrane protein